MDLDALFAPERSRRRPAQSLFTNRVAECESFEEARERVRQEIDGWVADPADLSRGRQNILCFYGMGGMGKSSLSRELQRRVVDEPLEGRLTLTSRMDFSRPGSFSLEQCLLQLRLDLLHRDLPAPAFDLAFGIYWEKAHPNERLADYLEQRGVVASLANRVGLAEQVETVLDETLNAFGAVRSGRRILVLLSDAFMDQVRRRKVMGSCPWFAPIVEEREPARMLPYLASLLGWDLIQAQQRGGVEVIVFWDTWERLHQPGVPIAETEDLLSRIAYLMPTALFVVTGRNRLTWADERSRHLMRYGGPDCWPGLAQSAGEPRQHLLGALSDKDRISYLSNRLQGLTEPNLDLVVRRIADGSVGLPLYLDLAATRVDQLAARSEPLDPAEFGGPLEELVVRVMYGLTECERRMLRAAAIGEAFDGDLLRAALRRACEERPSDAELRRFLEYDFVLRDRRRALPYGLHPRLRESVRACDDVSSDPWSPREWQEATLGALAELERRVAVTAADEPEGLDRDRGRLVWGVEAFEYAAAAGTAPEWLLPVLLTQRSLGDWAQLRRQVSLPHPPDSAYASLAGAMSALVEAKSGDGRRAEALYREVIDRPTTVGALRQFALLQLGELAILHGRQEQAAVELVRLVADGSRYAGTAAQHLAYLDWRAGRYPAALDWASAHAGDPVRQVHALDLHGLVAMEVGDLATATDRLQAALTVAEQTATPSYLATESRHLARVLALSQPEYGERMARQAIEYNRGTGSPLGESQALAALAVALSAQGRFADADAAIRDSHAALDAFGPGHSAGLVFPTIARLHVACRTGDRDGSRAAVRRLAESTDHRVWTVVGCLWHQEVFGEVLPESIRAAELRLTCGVDEFQRRWRSVTPSPV